MTDGCQGDQIGRRHALWLEQERGISVETAARFGIYTGRHSKIADAVIADPSGDILVFPFVDGGRVVSEKYRAAGKKFWQREGGLRTFWNADIMDDALLTHGAQALVITEGLEDALAVIECGHQFTVSVPDGAPSIPKGRKPDELEPLDPKEEGGGKFEFMWQNRDRLKRIKRFVIAVDSDAAGQRLGAELVRRLSAARCLFVTYPPEEVVTVKEPDDLAKWPSGKRPCKDMNEVLIHFGRDHVSRILTAAKPYPVKGLYRLSEYPDLPPMQGVSLGWQTLDQHILLFPGEFMVVTGVPSHGKSTWMLNVLVNLAQLYSWKSALFSPEMPTVPQLRDKLRRIVLGRDPAGDRSWIERADAWINDNLVFIDSDPTGADDDDYDLDWLLERATDAVLRHGIRVLAVDPWNEIEHARLPGETVTDYIGRAIRAFKRFGRLYEVAVIIIAHPTKDVVGKDGKTRSVTLYDVEGSAHWFNKCDHGVIVERSDVYEGQSLVRVAKVRFEETGIKGSVRLAFRSNSARYELLAAPTVPEEEP